MILAIQNWPLGFLAFVAISLGLVIACGLYEGSGQ